uniref:Uncharacterized protein n=1 Tax=Tetranychus urticae TaxID=32264 RepID=T1KES8_TETUR
MEQWERWRNAVNYHFLYQTLLLI